MLKKIILFWKKFSQKIGEVQAIIFLMFFYYLILLSVGVIFRIFFDTFRTRKEKSSQWLKRKKKRFLLKDLRTQY